MAFGALQAEVDAGQREILMKVRRKVPIFFVMTIIASFAERPEMRVLVASGAVLGRHSRE